MLRSTLSLLVLSACGPAGTQSATSVAGAKYAIRSAVVRLDNGPASGPGSQEKTVTLVLSDEDRGCADIARSYAVMNPMYGNSVPGADMSGLKDGAVIIGLAGMQIGKGQAEEWFKGTTLIGGSGPLLGAFGTFSVAAAAFESIGAREGHVTVDKIEGGFVEGSYTVRAGEIIVEGPFKARVCP